MIDKSKFKPCSMPCTEEQWQELKLYLYKYGIKYEHITSFRRYSVIVNNYGDENNNVTNVHYESKERYNRNYNPKFSIEWFLKNCGIIDYIDKSENTVIYNNFIVCM